MVNFMKVLGETPCQRREDRPLQPEIRRWLGALAWLSPDDCRCRSGQRPPPLPLCLCMGDEALRPATDEEEAEQLAAALAASLAQLELEDPLAPSAPPPASAESASEDNEPEPEDPLTAAEPFAGSSNSSTNHIHAAASVAGLSSTSTNNVVLAVDLAGVVRAVFDLAAAGLGGTRCPRRQPAPAASRPPPGVRPSEVPCAGTGSGAPYRPAAQGTNNESWAYAVWQIPGRPDFVGVHCRGGRAWEAIAQVLPNRRYLYSDGTRLRRYGGEQEAIRGYQLEAARHTVPASPVVFRW